MRRRLFIQSAPAAMALALTGCGGGGGGSASTGAEAATATVGAHRATSSVSGLAYPFGSRLQPYAAGILPTHESAAAMDDRIKACYDAWKAENVVPVTTVPGGLAVKFGADQSFRAVSEGMGMGMLIVVLMAGHDPDARKVFDGLLTTVRARPSYAVPAAMGGAYMMDWRLEMDGSSTDRAGGGWPALDGDLDIAMALLMADTQWGSGSTWNYRQEAINTINAMKAWNLKPDGTTKSLSTPHVSRTSDYMISHFRAFKRATGDPIWDLAVDRAYTLIDRMQNVYAPGTGLMPDFIVATDTAHPYPSPGGMGDFTDTEGYYYTNAQRNPWRYASDYVLSGDDRWKSVCEKLVDFVRADCKGNPAAIACGYHLNGNGMSRNYPPKGIIGPMTCGAMVDPRYQEFLNALWKWTAENFTTSYYDSELQLIPMIVASGNYWNP